MAARKRVIVAGRVQGVGFRYWTVGEAERLGVNGTVRNLPDGTVEAELEADPAVLDRMLDRLRTGPPSASVSGLEVRDVEPTGETGFRIAR